MVDMTGKFVRTIGARDKRRWSRSLFLWICFFLLFGFAGPNTAEAANAQNGAVSAIGPGPQFAIADFDGDLRPDLARVQAGSTSSGSTSYWIQLRFSAVGQQSIRLLGPAGGLRIEARDVNGDHAVDLVLATAWFNRPVAVFLNNGHGGFSRAEPAAFPGAFSESKTKWASVSHQGMEAVGIPSQSDTGFSTEASCPQAGRSPAGSIPFPSRGFLLRPLLVSHAERAPPSEVPQF
jgi:hypothetical protein